jgi:putative membrane protein
MTQDHRATPAPSERRLALALLIASLLLLGWSAYKPREYLTWALEVFPAVAGIAILAATYRRFPFTPLLYWLMALHSALLIVGGHYTYSHVPLGEWFQDWLNLSRNHYDRLGHFVQGLVPAMIAREVLLRTSPLRPGGWLFTLCVCVAVAISGVYELIEWAVAEIDHAGSQEFLGTQGDIWDTQKDIALALAGALIAQLTFTRWHDRQLSARSYGQGPPATTSTSAR